MQTNFRRLKNRPLHPPSDASASNKSITLGLGTGHALGGENPDYTYNHPGCCLGLGAAWNTNEERTYEMEKEVFLKLKAFSKDANHQEASVATIDYTLKTFNKFQTNASSKNFADKIAILNNALKYLEYDGIDMTYASDSKSNANEYNVEVATKNRADSLNRLKPNDYIGTILPGGTAPLPEPKK